MNKTLTLTPEQIFNEPFPFVNVRIKNKKGEVVISEEGELVVI